MASFSCSALMAKMQFLTILLTVTFFLGGVLSVTDKEFEVSSALSSNIYVHVSQTKVSNEENIICF